MTQNLDWDTSEDRERIEQLEAERDALTAENKGLRVALDWALDHAAESALEERNHPGEFQKAHLRCSAYLDGKPVTCDGVGFSWDEAQGSPDDIPDLHCIDGWLCNTKGERRRRCQKCNGKPVHDRQELAGRLAGALSWCQDKIDLSWRQSIAGAHHLNKFKNLLTECHDKLGVPK